EQTKNWKFWPTESQKDCLSGILRIESPMTTQTQSIEYPTCVWPISIQHYGIPRRTIPPEIA
ncbi:hypothetical protein OAF96_00145, partial [bacterium]|nr:hypothetical protein [bacterium]